MKKVYPRKCLVCKTKFKPRGENHVVCSISCATAKKNDKQQKAVDKVKKKIWVKEKAVLKAKCMRKSDAMKLLQIAVNAYVRKRDEKEGCISCEVKECEQFHAGHYIASTYQFLRFNPDNIHKQCSRCNMYLSGNSIPYRENLIKKIGLCNVVWLENNKHRPFEMTIPEIQDKAKEYRQKVKELKSNT
jgi:hypothetical protein